MEPIIPLTIAIPVYKRAHAIAPLLRAIAAQAGPEDDLLILDDASGDDIAAVVEGVNANLRLICHDTNLGMVGNWNACLEQARHPWICIVHHDDILGSCAVATLRTACKLAGRPSLITHLRQDRDLDDGFRYRWCEPGPWAVLRVPTIPSGAIIHREIVETIGGFDPKWKYSSDLEYFARICMSFPLLVVESPDVVRNQMHGLNHQYETWRQSDFDHQLREVQRTILGYAGFSGEGLRRRLKDRMRDFYHHMFMATRAIHDRPLLRRVARQYARSAGLPWRVRALVAAAALTGWAPPPRQNRRPDPGAQEHSN